MTVVDEYFLGILRVIAFLLLAIDVIIYIIDPTVVNRVVELLIRWFSDPVNQAVLILSFCWTLAELLEGREEVVRV